MTVRDLPTLNAFLNAMTGVVLLCGFVAIKRGAVRVHIALMISALVLAVAFLSSYLYYHFNAGLLTRFGHEGSWLRPLYFTILISHTILAALVLPMVITTVTFAARKNYARHRRWARVTFPIWVYVSVTGVVVYVMLYHF